MEILDIKKECRICYEDVNKDLDICDCTGTMGYVHLKCILRWYDINLNLIKYRFKTIRKCELCNKNVNILIYKPFSFYFIFIILMFVYIIFIFHIYKIEDLNNNSLNDDIFYSILFFVLGATYYSILFIILNKCLKNKISFT
jgi:hypothetical protein